MSFAPQESGWLLLQGDELGLLVTGGQNAGYLRLHDWLLTPPNAAPFVVAKKWQILFAGADGKLEPLLPKRVDKTQMPIQGQPG